MQSTTHTAEKNITIEEIFKNLPISTRYQKKYRAKVVFLDAKKTDEHYESQKRINCNGNSYMIIDGGISILPEEAYAGLVNACGYITKFRDRKQSEYGINHEDPNDRFLKEKIPRFDVTVLEEYTPIEDEDGNIIHLTQQDLIKYTEEGKVESGKFVISKKEIEKAEAKEEREDKKEAANFRKSKEERQAEKDKAVKSVKVPKDEE